MGLCYIGYISSPTDYVVLESITLNVTLSHRSQQLALLPCWIFSATLVKITMNVVCQRLAKWNNTKSLVHDNNTYMEIANFAQ